MPVITITRNKIILFLGKHSYLRTLIKFLSRFCPVSKGTTYIFFFFEHYPNNIIFVENIIHPYADPLKHAIIFYLRKTSYLCTGWSASSSGSQYRNHSLTNIVHTDVPKLGLLLHNTIVWCTQHPRVVLGTYR